MPATKDFTTNDLSILRIGPFSPALNPEPRGPPAICQLSQLAPSHSTPHKTTVTTATTTQPASSMIDHDGHRLGICTV